MAQLALTFTVPPRAGKLQARFEAFHRANPHVYATLLELARKAKAAGKERIGIKALWEVCRWEIGLRTRGDEFRCNNDYTAGYARLLMQEPDLDGMFELRQRRSA